MEVIAVTINPRYANASHFSGFGVITPLEILQLVASGRYENIMKRSLCSFCLPKFPGFCNSYAYVRYRFTRVYIRQHLSSCQSTFQKWREYCISFELSPHFFTMCHFMVLCAVGESGRWFIKVMFFQLPLPICFLTKTR